MAEKKELQNCLEGLVIETFLQCKDRCVREIDGAIVISLADEDFMNTMLNIIEENIAYILNKEDFVNEMARIMSEERNKKLKGKVVKDMTGTILYFEEEK